MTQRPLDGIKIVDLSSFLAGPIGAMFLGDFGAEVIKIEKPGKGDESRFWGNNKDGVGLYYKVLNRNKKSITVDLRTPFGVEVVKRLAEDADLIIENFRPGTLEKWGMGFDVLHDINPRLCLLRITGYGQTGPYRRKPGFGTLAEAFSGFVHINGTPELPPLLPGFGMADATTGLMAAFLATTALLGVKNRGLPGQVIDLALYETLLTLLGPQVVDFDQLGIIQQRAGSRLPFTAPRNTYQTKDGKWVSMAGSAQSTFERICQALDLPHIPDDPRFSDNRQRLIHAKELDEELQKGVAQYDLQQLLDRFETFEATAAPVNDIAQIIADPHVIARENIISLFDAELNADLRMQNVVGKFSENPGCVAHSGPVLGADNYAVLVEQLGFPADRVAQELAAADPANTPAVSA